MKQIHSVLACRVKWITRIRSTFDLGETVASLTPAPRLLIALHPSLDWIQEIGLDYCPSITS
jgi:hypothetical protein